MNYPKTLVALMFALFFAIVAGSLADAPGQVIAFLMGVQIGLLVSLILDAFRRS